MEIDIDEARRNVSYDPETGRFWWIVSKRGPRKAGDEAGAPGADGSRCVKINQRKHYAHRLAWAMFYGEQPPEEIDHIDRDPSNNRILNLRAATRIQNCQNRGGEGIRFEPDRQRWLARITHGGRQMNLGRFKTESEARAARVAAERALFGEFARNDR